MLLLLDESVPKRLGKHLPGHESSTVVDVGWSGTRNGKLLALAATRFDALITVDKGFEHQQNLATLPVAVVLLDALSNELEILLPLVPNLLAMLTTLRPRTFNRVSLGA